MNTGGILGFAIWAAVALVLVGIGIYDLRTDRQVEVGFWAGIKTPPMRDVKAYNRAVGKLFIAYGLILILLGLPLLTGNALLIILSIAGIMLESIVFMAVYMVGIQGKYEKK